LISQTLSNPLNTQGTVTYTVTPIVTVSPTLQCPGIPVSTTITIQPVPTVFFNPVSDTICSGQSSVPVNLGSNVTGVNYSWSANAPSGVGGMNPNPTIGVSNPIPSFTLTDTTSAPLNTIVTANAIINGCPGPSSNYSITVHPLPVPSFTLAAVACVNTSVPFNNTSSGGSTYLWNFGDGNFSTLFSPLHVYTSQGTYTVTLVVTSAAGCVDSITDNIIIIGPPVPYFTILPDSGCGPLTVQFNNATTGFNTSYDWNFYGGVPGTSNLQTPPPVTFPSGILNDTTYAVTLVAYNVCDTISYTDSVLVHPSPVAGFGMNVNSGCSPLTISFNNTSYGLPTSYFWDFGDNTTSTDMNPPPHVFTATTTVQTYIITLTATNQCGSDVFTDTLTVYPNTVTAFFNTNPDFGCSPLTVNFTNFSTGATVYSWNFGDSTYSNLTSPTHVFTHNNGTSTPQVYTVMLAANNGCSYDTIYQQVTVYPQPNLSMNINPTDSVCANSLVQFFNTTTDQLSSISWDFGDGTTSSLTNPTHTYSSAGTYIVTMYGIGAAYACPDTIRDTILVIDLPVAQVSASPASGCEDLVVTITNLTTGATGHQWNFGDGNTYGTSSPTHTYQNPGTYTITYVAFNNAGCTDTATLQVVVYPAPIANFELSQDTFCIGTGTITLTNFSTGASGYSWNFGPFGTSSQANPQFSFSNQPPGIYPVTLTAQTSFGCTATVTKNFEIFQPPVADFVVPDPIACEGEFVQFTNLSTNGISYLWDFGDGITSTSANPLHAYQNSGLYTVQLIVVGLGGCIDSIQLSNPISVYESPDASFTYTTDPNPENYGTVIFTNGSVGASSYIWEFGDGNSSTLQDPIHQYLNYGYYDVMLIATNDFGCKDTALETLTVPYFCGLQIPNAFMPNTAIEKVNVFWPQGRGLGRYHIWVRDAWGNLVWESNKLVDGIPSEWWDGKGPDGLIYPGDVYVWEAEAMCIDGTPWPGQVRDGGPPKRAGTVTIIK
jgi:PKD repeat protein